MKELLIIIVIGAFLYWLIILRLGRRDFWKIANNHPNEAYDFFIENENWKVFEDGLPDNYRSIMPAELWTGKFRLYVPKLSKVIYIFGKYPDFENTQNDFMMLFDK